MWSTDFIIQRRQWKAAEQWIHVSSWLLVVTWWWRCDLSGHSQQTAETLDDFKVGIGVSVGCQCWCSCLPKPPNTMTGVAMKLKHWCQHQRLFNTECLWMVLSWSSKNTRFQSTPVLTPVLTLHALGNPQILIHWMLFMLYSWLWSDFTIFYLNLQLAFYSH